MFSYHPMTLIRAFLLLFVAAEFFLVVDLLIQGIASVIAVAASGVAFVFSLITISV